MDLTIAVRLDDIDKARLLLDDDKIDTNTPLIYASLYYYREVVSLLLDHGADPNIQDNYSVLLIHYLV